MPPGRVYRSIGAPFSRPPSLRRGTGDSETIFLAALAHGLDHDPVAAVSRTLAVIAGSMAANGVTRALRFAAVHSDGRTLWAYRWPSDAKAPSLCWRRTDADVVVASEPMDDKDWTEVEPGTVLVATSGIKVRAQRLAIAG